MSESKRIVDHENALDIYFEEMLNEVAGDTLKNKAFTKTIKHKVNKPFRALLFNINGLQLAIATEDVKAILPWPEKPLEQNQETNNKQVIMGFYNQIKILNTAHIVLPIQQQHNIATPSFMIVVNTGPWALSCHKIDSVINFSPKEVRWRKNIKAKPWLAGMSIEKSCTIINSAALEILLS